MLARARLWSGIVALAVGTTAFVATPPAAHAASVVAHTVLLDVRSETVPVANAADPTCTHEPGIVRSAKVWVDTYVTSSLGRYNGMKWSFATTYRIAVANAAQAWKDQFGTTPSCAFLNSFDGAGPLHALRQTTCLNPSANPAVRPNRWCALEARADAGLALPSTVDLNTQVCRAPQWNNGNWGPLGWASWHNQHVKLQTTDILDQLGLGWVPGHFNIDTYAQDFELLSGVANLDPSTLQPAAGDSRFLGFGKVQTASASEQWVRFYDAVARAKGVDPVARPVYAHDTVAANAIANNARLTITLVPGVTQPITVNVGDYKRQLFQSICSSSPWVADVLGDSNGPHLVLSLPEGPCDLGFTFYRPASSAGNGYSFLQFVQKFSPDDAKQLKGHETQTAQILQEAFNNRDTVNPLLVKSPFDTDAQGHTILHCNVQQNLGVSRGTHDNPDGSLNTDLPDPHFRRFFQG